MIYLHCAAEQRDPRQPQPQVRGWALVISVPCRANRAATRGPSAGAPGGPAGWGSSLFWSGGTGLSQPPGWAAHWGSHRSLENESASGISLQEFSSEQPHSTEEPLRRISGLFSLPECCQRQSCWLFGHLQTVLWSLADISLMDQRSELCCIKWIYTVPIIFLVSQAD